jgi:hypothetical protein
MLKKVINKTIALHYENFSTVQGAGLVVVLWPPDHFCPWRQWFNPRPATQHSLFPLLYLPIYNTYCIYTKT